MLTDARKEDAIDEADRTSESNNVPLTSDGRNDLALHTCFEERQEERSDSRLV